MIKQYMEQLKPIQRAASIYYGTKILLGLEMSVNKWLKQKQLPFRISGVEYTPYRVTVKLKHTQEDIIINFSFSIR